MSSDASAGRQGKAYGEAEILDRFARALESLMSDGTTFRDLSVGRLAAAAGIARSTFYATFGDKAGMLNALSARSLESVYAGAQSWMRHGADATREDVATGMNQVLAAYRDHETVMRAVAEASAYEPVVRDTYDGNVENYARAMARMIRQGVSEGRMRDVTGPQTASVLAWATESGIRRAALHPPGDSADAIIAALADVVHRTLFP